VAVPAAVHEDGHGILGCARVLKDGLADRSLGEPVGRGACGTGARRHVRSPSGSALDGGRQTVEPLAADLGPGTLVRRTGRFLGRTLRWTTEVTGVSANHLDLRIVDGPMRGTVAYRIERDESGSRVTIRNVGQAPGFAPRWLLTFAMRRALAADLRRLQRAVEGST